MNALELWLLNRKNLRLEREIAREVDASYLRESIQDRLDTLKELNPRFTQDESSRQGINDFTPANEFLGGEETSHCVHHHEYPECPEVCSDCVGDADFEGCLCPRFCPEEETLESLLGDLKRREHPNQLSHQETIYENYKTPTLSSLGNLGSESAVGSHSHGAIYGISQGVREGSPVGSHSHSGEKEECVRTDCRGIPGELPIGPNIPEDHDGPYLDDGMTDVAVSYQEAYEDTKELWANAAERNKNLNDKLTEVALNNARLRNRLEAIAEVLEESAREYDDFAELTETPVVVQAYAIAREAH